MPSQLPTNNLLLQISSPATGALNTSILAGHAEGSSEIGTFNMLLNQAATLQDSSGEALPPEGSLSPQELSADDLAVLDQTQPEGEATDGNRYFSNTSLNSSTNTNTSSLVVDSSDTLELEAEKSRLSEDSVNLMLETAVLAANWADDWSNESAQNSPNSQGSVEQLGLNNQQALETVELDPIDVRKAEIPLQGTFVDTNNLESEGLDSERLQSVLGGLAGSKNSDQVLSNQEPLLAASRVESDVRAQTSALEGLASQDMEAQGIAASRDVTSNGATGSLEPLVDGLGKQGLYTTALASQAALSNSQAAARLDQEASLSELKGGISQERPVTESVNTAASQSQPSDLASRMASSATANPVGLNNGRQILQQNLSAELQKQVESALSSQKGTLTESSARGINAPAESKVNTPTSNSVAERTMQPMEFQLPLKGGVKDGFVSGQEVREKVASAAVVDKMSAFSMVSSHQPTLASPSPDIQLKVPTGMTPSHPQWSQAVSERVVWSAGQHLKTATIQLDPPELGSLQIKLQISQEQVSVTFTSPHGVVRDAVEGSIPRLREMLAEQGLDLDESFVNDQSSSEQDKRSFEDGSNYAAGNNLAGDQVEAEMAASKVMDRGQLSLVDYYA